MSTYTAEGSTFVKEDLLAFYRENGNFDQVVRQYGSEEAVAIADVAAFSECYDGEISVKCDGTTIAHVLGGLVRRAEA